MTDLDAIIDDFTFLDEWDDRYKYLIDLGRNLSTYPEEFRTEQFKVRGCASQVWLYATRENEKFHFQGDSDAHIVRGLVAIIIALYSEKSANEILNIDPKEVLRPLKLDGHLTPQRTNGLAAMIERIHALAKQH